MQLYNNYTTYNYNTTSSILEIDPQTGQKTGEWVPLLPLSADADKFYPLTPASSHTYKILKLTLFNLITSVTVSGILNAVCGNPEHLPFTLACAAVASIVDGCITPLFSKMDHLNYTTRVLKVCATLILTSALLYPALPFLGLNGALLNLFFLESLAVQSIVRAIFTSNKPNNPSMMPFCDSLFF